MSMFPHAFNNASEDLNENSVNLYIKRTSGVPDLVGFERN